MAYKHPQLLIGDEKDECEKVESPTTPVASGCCDDNGTTMKSDANHCNVNANDECQDRSTTKNNTFNGSSNGSDSISSGQQVSERSGVLNTNCHLIGNVKPNLIKTWERLNGKPPSTQSSAYQNGSADQVDIHQGKHGAKIGHEQPPQQQQRDTYINPSIYLNTKYHVFSHQPLANLPQNNNDESFVIRRPPSKSGYFYDSIEVETRDDDDDDDNDDDEVDDVVDEQEVIASLCDELEHGGEGMAEYISLMEKKEKHCWSIDSCN